MSYSKYHYLENALAEINKLLEGNGKKPINIKDNFFECFSICYICFYYQRRGLDYSGTFFDAINTISTTTIKEFLFKYLNDIANFEISVLQKIPFNEVDNYIHSYFKYVKSIKKDLCSEIPLEIFRLADLLLVHGKGEKKLLISDEIIKCSKADLSNNVKSYSMILKDTDISRAGEIINEITGKPFSIRYVDFLEEQLNEKFGKIICNCIFSTPIAMTEKIAQIAEKFGEADQKEVFSAKLYIQKIIDSLAEKGTALVMVPLSFLLKEHSFIKYLLSKGYLNTVVQLAENLLPNTNESLVFLILSFGNTDGILIINASNYYMRIHTRYFIDPKTQSLIYKSIREKTSINKFITKEELAEHNFNVLPITYFIYNKTIKEGIPLIPLSKLATIRRGVQFPSRKLIDINTDTETDYLYLNPCNIIDHEIRHIDYLKVLTEEEEKLCIKDKDLLMSVAINNSFKVAVANIDKGKHMLVSSNLYILSLDLEKINPYYLEAWLLKESTQKLLRSYCSPICSVGFLSELLIPVPSLAKQNKIAAQYKAIKADIYSHEMALKKLQKQREEFLLKV